ncbi:MAG: hypothetical protein CMM46_11145 [Rhodospirillaceae bacterium]|nr:hypothetical protein [Rhodospirillaceae bacterium]
MAVPDLKPRSGAVLASSRLRKIVLVASIVAVVWVTAVVSLGGWRGDHLSQKHTAQAHANALTMAQANGLVLERRFEALRTVASLLTERDRMGRAAFAFNLRSQATDREAWDDLLQDGDLQVLSQQLGQTAQELSVDGIFLANETGYIFAASNWDQGLTHLTESFQDAQHFRDAMTHGSGEQFGVDTVNGQPRFFFSVRLNRGAQVQGVVTVSTSSERLMPLLQRGREDVLLTDENGIVIASSNDDWMYRSMGKGLTDLMTTVQLGLRYGRSEFLEMPGPMMADHIPSMAETGLVGASDDAEGFESHVFMDVDGLKVIRRDNLIMIIGLASFGVLLVLVVGLALAQIAAIRERAIRDPLTGLYNRRYIDESLPGLIELDERGRLVGLALVTFDLDKFKGINDTWGHDIGDKVLRHFATILVDCSRRTDLPCRVGGEEFVTFLIEEDLDRVEIYAERVRQRTEAIDSLAPVPAGRITTSAGLVMRRQGEGIDEMVKRADVLLYRAKENGRNRLERDDREETSVPDKPSTAPAT